MRIFFFTKYSRKGASSRYRTYQYQDVLRESGIKTRSFSLFNDRYLEDLYEGRASSTPISDLYWQRWRDMKWVGDSDLVVVEKEFLPFLPAALERNAFRDAKRILLDYDDAIFFKYQNHPKAAVRWLLGKKLDHLMALSDGVVAGNQFLREYATQHAPRAWRVPTSVDTGKYEPHDHDHGGLITLGWIGTPITAKYLELLRRPVERLAREAAVRFLVIGAEAPDWQGVDGQSQPWSEKREAELVRWMDIGLMPLEDTPWERGKCGLKLLQYMASGVVPVGSDLGANREILEHGTNGFLCRTEQEWTDCLFQLARDPGLRIEVGRRARQKVVAEYSVEVAAQSLLKIYREVAGESVEAKEPARATVPGTLAGASD
jgi:glycosyltransferase involved in cell wall biosynthesis